MKLTGNTILITGGGTGIGLAFAKRFLNRGNQVIICGRRESTLQAAKEQAPGIIVRRCDLSIEAERISLFDWITANHSEINVLINNAGILQHFNLLKADAKSNWDYFNNEITINLEAPIHLSMLFAPFLTKKNQAAIINVTSGLAFTPLAVAPIYSATKAAMHSFSMSLRYQLSATSVEVIEVVPPAVDTNLNGTWLKTQIEPLNAFADGIFLGLEDERNEIGYSTSEARLGMSREEINMYSEKMHNAMKPTIEE